MKFIPIFMTLETFMKTNKFLTTSFPEVICQLCENKIMKILLMITV